MNSNSTQLCHCGEEQDALMMCTLGKNRTYMKVKLQDVVEIEKVYEY